MGIVERGAGGGAAEDLGGLGVRLRVCGPVVLFRDGDADVAAAAAAAAAGKGFVGGRSWLCVSLGVGGGLAVGNTGAGGGGGERVLVGDFVRVGGSGGFIFVDVGFSEESVLGVGVGVGARACFVWMVVLEKGAYFRNMDIEREEGHLLLVTCSSGPWPSSVPFSAPPAVLPRGRLSAEESNGAEKMMMVSNASSKMVEVKRKGCTS